jgi:drug/metabolite transporter (DMT)-like permease
LNQSASGSLTGFFYVLGTVLLTVYGQLIVKWRVAQAGDLPAAFPEKMLFLGKLLLNPWILSGMAAAFIAMLCWLSAMTKFELSYVYPFMSLAFVLVLILSVVLFQERVTLAKILGVALVMVGIIVASRG